MATTTPQVAHEVPPPRPAAPAAPAGARSGRLRRLIFWLVCLLLLAAAAYASVPWIQRTLSTVSTDDAYVNGHVTFVAPRVAGQVSRVLVDDNNRVRKGDLLVQLDKEPFQVQVDIAKS